MTAALRRTGSATARGLREAGVVARALWIVVAVLVVVRVWQGWSAAGDLRVIWLAGRHLLDGAPVFGDPYFIYLPTSAVLAAPFALLPGDVGINVGVLLCCAAVLVLCWSSARLLARPAPNWLAPLAAAVVLTSYAGGDLMMVANSEFVAFAMLPAILFAASRNRWTTFAVLLGVSIAVKPFLVALLLLPVLARQGRALLIALAIPVLGSAVALVFVVDSRAFLHTTIPNLISGQVVLDNPSNASLSNLLSYAGVPEPWSTVLRALVVVIGVGAAVLRWYRTTGDRTVRVVEVGTLLLLTSSIASSVVWSHYSLVLVPLLVIAMRPGAVSGRTAVLWPLLLPMFALGYPVADSGVWGTVMVRVGGALLVILLVLAWQYVRRPAADDRQGARRAALS